jgi:rRNA maturation endonuclease Nob1
MYDIDTLPVPDWGLKCPGCGASLAGVPEHRCSSCGKPFEIRFLLSRQRPIPDLGLACPHCDYLLVGLLEERCPECGRRFSLRAMLEDQSAGGAVFDESEETGPQEHHLPRRPPEYTGQERPLPEFGLCCADCGAPLAGATGDACSSCGGAFDLEAIVPSGEWVALGAFVPKDIRSQARGILYRSGVPYVVDNEGLNQVYGGVIPLVRSRLRVPRAYFFDALYALAEAQAPIPSFVEQPWQCAECGERVPKGFEVCWNCGELHPEHPDREEVNPDSTG